MTVTILPGEVWYGPWAHLGYEMPIDGTKEISIHCMPVNSGNQVQPFMLSNQGRYVWADDGFNVEVRNGELHFTGGEPILCEECGSLKEAFLHAAKRYFLQTGSCRRRSSLLRPSITPGSSSLITRPRKRSSDTPMRLLITVCPREF